jgi:O-antigen/teichoic acid export membrane protein
MSMDDETSETLIYNESLQKIAKGASLVFIGLLGALFPTFIGKLIIIRYWTEDEYGIFSLAITILVILSTVSTLGLSFGVSRSIAYARGKNEYEKIPDLISTSILICLIVSIVLSSIIFILSDFISVGIFNEQGLANPIKIFSIAIPFLTLINVIVSIFRGFDRVKPTVIFHQLLWNLLFPIFLIVVVFIDKNFINIFYTYISAIIITSIILILYSIRFVKRKNYPPIRFFKSNFNKELIIFSLPLLGTSIFNLIITWTDTLMLGVFNGTFYVGLYNGALPLATFITFPLTALLSIYVPIFSGLYAKKLFKGIRRNFSVVTKWLCLATLPIFLILFLYPGQILNFLFGQSYTAAANVLRILALGFMINNFLGPNGATLISMGKSSFIFISSLTAALINIILNYSLIPQYGMMGAAVASAFSILSINTIKVVKLYSLNKVQPLSKNLLKPTLLTLVFVIGLYFVMDYTIVVKIWMIPLIFLTYYIIYIAAIFFTKSIDQEDLNMLEMIEQISGFKSKIIKKLLKKLL